MSQKEVERIKKMYPKGTRILIERMNDALHCFPDGQNAFFKVDILPL